MSICHLDFETRSACDLPKQGSDKYAAHPTTSVLCACWSIDEGAIHLWTPDMPPPTELLDHARNGGVIAGHNSGGFEILIWNYVCTLQYGWPEITIDQIEDSMARVYAMGLPGSLENAAIACCLDTLKDKAGSRAMLQLSKPRKTLPDGTIIWWEKEDVPEKFETLYAYCKQDVLVERNLCEKVLSLSDAERKLWIADWHINRRGVKVDVDAAEIAIEMVAVEQDRLDQEMREVTSGAVATCTAAGQLKDWLKLQGVAVPSLAKAELIELLKTDLPQHCVRPLTLRQEGSKTSTAKLKAMVNCAGHDGRIRGLFQYHGASTGRWAGRKVQLQNLKRPTVPQSFIDAFFDIVGQVKSKKLRIEDAVEMIAIIYGSPMDLISNCVRGFLVAEEGNLLTAADLSAIESRVLAWLAGEESKLEIFRTHGRQYEAVAAQIYNCRIDDVTKAQRQIGKVAELALGYQGGSHAFITMGEGYGVVVAKKEANEIKENWRFNNPNIVRYWSKVEDAALRSVLNPGVKVKVGPHGREVVFLTVGTFLWCRLPSGRALCYPYPEIRAIKTPWGMSKEGVTYMGENTLTRKWERLKTYGGKLTENITQAVARDVLAESIMVCDGQTLETVMHVHDEIVIERGADATCDYNEVLEQIMTRTPDWATDLPLGAEAWSAKRYRK